MEGSGAASPALMRGGAAGAAATAEACSGGSPCLVGVAIFDNAACLGVAGEGEGLGEPPSMTLSRREDCTMRCTSFAAAGVNTLRLYFRAVRNSARAASAFWLPDAHTTLVLLTTLTLRSPSMMPFEKAKHSACESMLLSLPSCAAAQAAVAAW